jgi:ElaB/YqjD/DUF883 family membrane-anchored ribosome-binding protein
MTTEREKIEAELDEYEDQEGELENWIEQLDVMTADIEEMHSTGEIWGIDSGNALGAHQELERFRDKVESKLTRTRHDVRDLKAELRRLDDEDAEDDEDLAELLEVVT